ncbi:hypothetical protein ABXJ76_06475 [Methylobacter sp. G7]|uniref:hypothetical protein n=1 Tax=Methylobacter sp. G7 TaxID=3230117 RepID=UPI003D80369B
MNAILIRTRQHNERCPQCKLTVRNMLTNVFGKVEANWSSGLPCKLADYNNTDLADSLGAVHEALQNHRGNNQFVFVNKLPRVDYFIPDQNLIVEFDESQHFTKPRNIALSHYPQGKDYGFNVEKWREICQKLDKRDNDPKYRDEQRAWYDTLRDIAPQLLGCKQTVRLYSRDLVWCSLNPDSESDLLKFKQIILQVNE